MSDLIFLDTETTGNQDSDRICQVAFRNMTDGVAMSEFFKPPMPITIEAMAVTHITEKMVANSPKFVGSPMHKYLTQKFFEGAILVAHNSEFDAKMLKNEGVDVHHQICTMKVARHHDIKDELPNYKMQFVRYYLGLEIHAEAHNAADDIKVLESIYNHYSKVYTIDEMLKITREPFLLRKLTFGKHKGIPCSKIPRDYWRWLQQQDGITGDLLYTIKHYINKEPKFL